MAIQNEVSKPVEYHRSEVVLFNFIQKQLPKLFTQASFEHFDLYTIKPNGEETATGTLSDPNYKYFAVMLYNVKDVELNFLVLLRLRVTAQVSYKHQYYVDGVISLHDYQNPTKRESLESLLAQLKIKEIVFDLPPN